MLTHSFVEYLIETENSPIINNDINLFESKIQYHLRNFMIIKEREMRTKSKLWTIVVNYNLGCPRDFINTEKVIVKTFHHLPEISKTQFELYAETKDDAMKWIENSFNNISKVSVI